MTTARELIANLITSRVRSMRSLLDDPRKDLDSECGWPATEEIRPEHYRNMYERLGIASRVVDVYPDESWRESPEIYETEDVDHITPFEERWNYLNKNHQLIARMHRADQLSGIGRFGIILLGVGDKKSLDKPIDGIDDYGQPTGVPKEREFLYARCYDESKVRIEDEAWNTDVRSPRFGMPKYYNVNLGGDSIMQGNRTQKVHWTRVVHLADNRKESEVFAVPRMLQVYNHLLDIRKVVGSSSEMFYKGGFPGIAAIGDPKLIAAGASFDAVELKKELEAYQETLQRYLAVAGADIKTLEYSIADPKHSVEMLILLICITIGVPLRIFMGSEQGKLAADQDSKNWSKRISGRQKTYCTPMIIQPVIQRLIAAGCLPTPSTVIIDWPDMESPTASEKADVALKLSKAMSDYVTGGGMMLMDNIHFLSMVMKFSPEEASEAAKSVRQMEDEEKTLLGELKGTESGNDPADDEEESDDNDE